MGDVEIISKSTIDSNTGAGAQLGKWIYDKTHKGAVMSAEAGSQLSRFVRGLRGGRLTNEGHVRGMMSQARAYCEKYMGCTIQNVRGVGYRIATEKEKAVYYGKWVNKTLACAERTIRLQVIVKREHIPYALKEITRRAESCLDNANRIRPRFAEQLMGYLTAQKETEEKDK